MPTTANLGLTIPTVGGSSDAWGTILNELFDDLDSALGDAGVSEGIGGLTVNIDGGTIDGTVIGGTTPAAITGTTVTVSTSGSVSTPAYTFSGDTDTGIYRDGINALAIAAGGTRIARFNDVGGGGIVFYDDVNIGGANNIYCDGGEIRVGGAINHDGSTAGFFGATPVAQQTDPGGLTDNTGGIASSSVDAVSGTYSASEVNNNFASVVDDLNALRTALFNLGLIA